MTAASTSTPRPAPRQARALRNDARTVEAAGRITATEGWAALAPSRVAVAAELARSTVQERYRDRSALGAAVWNETCGPAVGQALANVLGAAGLLGSPFDERALGASLEALADPSIPLRAGAELLVAAHYDPQVGLAVADSLGNEVGAWFTRGDDAARASAGYLLMVGLGALLASRRTGAADIDWQPIVEALCAALASPASPGPLPDATSEHLVGDLDLAPGDPALDALLNAALREIGAHGFEGASVDAIARASRHTKGLIFSRFPSKLELFLEASRRQQTLAYAANESFLSEVAEQHGRGIAEAVTLRELQAPRLAYSRAIVLEQLRLSWHVRELKAAQEADLDAVVAAMGDGNDGHFAHNAAVVHFAYAVGLGAAALPLLYPQAWTLSYDVMTVPLVDLGL